MRSSLSGRPSSLKLLGETKKKKNKTASIAEINNASGATLNPAAWEYRQPAQFRSNSNISSNHSQGQASCSLYPPPTRWQQLTVH